MRDYTQLFIHGNNAQLEKLRENEHKSGWNKMSFTEIKNLIYEEFSEVKYELEERYIDAELLRRECADLANACHFIICKCDKELLK